MALGGRGRGGGGGEEWEARRGEEEVEGVSVRQHVRAGRDSSAGCDCSDNLPTIKAAISRDTAPKDMGTRWFGSAAECRFAPDRLA